MRHGSKEYQDKTLVAALQTQTLLSLSAYVAALQACVSLIEHITELFSEQQSS